MFDSDAASADNSEAILLVKKVLRRMQIPDYGAKKYVQVFKDNWLMSVDQVYFVMYYILHDENKKLPGTSTCYKST